MCLIAAVLLAADTLPSRARRRFGHGRTKKMSPDFITPSVSLLMHTLNKEDGESGQATRDLWQAGKVG